MIVKHWRPIAGAFLLVLIFLQACESPVTLRQRTSAGASLNILSFAGNFNGPLHQPWQAADSGVLSTAQDHLPHDGDEGSLVIAAITETVLNCSGGGTITRTRDNQPPPWFSSGDIYTQTFDACVEAGTQTDGVRSFSVDALEGQMYIDPLWTLTTTTSRSGFSKSDIATGATSTADGSQTTTLAAQALPDNISAYSYTQSTSSDWSRSWPNGDTLNNASGSGQVTYSWSDGVDVRFVWEFDVMVSTDLFGQTAAKTVLPLEGPLNGAPDTGSFQISKLSVDGLSSVITATVQSADAILLEEDVDGDGVVDSSRTVTWQELVLEPVIYQFI